MALEVQIRKKLGSFQLNVAFTTGAQWTGLLGASGCGKSVTLKCIAGVEVPDEGYIRYNGRVLFDSAQKINLPPQHRRVGYLFQSYALFPHMTVLENIRIGIPRGANRDTEAQSAVERFCLQGLEDKRPGELSGGQQQRTALARLIASRPDMILLDEPFAALDSHLKWRLERELRYALASYRDTILMVSHNRDEIYRMCEQACVFSNGTIEASGSVRHVFESPRTVQTALLTGCKNISAAKRTGDYTVRCIDWGVSLVTAAPVSADVCAVGIRRHDVRFTPQPEGLDNTYPVQLVDEVDGLFSSIAAVRTPDAAPGDDGLVECDLRKADWLALRNGKLYLHLPKEHLLLLR